MDVEGVGGEILDDILKRTKRHESSRDIANILQSAIDEVSKGVKSEESERETDSVNTLDRAKSVAQQIDASELGSMFEGDEFSRSGSIILTKNNIKTFKV